MSIFVCAAYVLFARVCKIIAHIISGATKLQSTIACMVYGVVRHSISLRYARNVDRVSWHLPIPTAID